MLLLTGPPGSGKTYRVLEKVRDCARRGATDTRLIVPTATMAEHLRNGLAREGLLVRPQTVQTLWQFVDAIPGLPQQVPDAVFRNLVRASIAEVNPSSFRPIASMPGFQSAVADLIREWDLSGASPDRIEEIVRRDPVRTGFAKPVLEIAARVRTACTERGMAMRGDRLRRAAHCIGTDGPAGIREILFDGFFRFTPIELELIRALASHIGVTITLPDWDGAASARNTLLASGFREQTCSPRRPNPERQLFAASSPDREAEEIARRVLSLAAGGRQFREIGVIVRSAVPYAPILRRAFARFRVPARFYFAKRLASHPAIRQIEAAVNVLLGGWEQEDLIAAVRLQPASASLDRIEYDLLESLQKNHDVHPPEDTFRRRLQDFGSWQTDNALPSLWAERLFQLPRLFPPPPITDEASHQQALIWRSDAAARKAFGDSVAAAAELMGDGHEVPLAAFWQETSAILADTDLRIDDNRRNVVHVMDAYEARQWELPVMFVCGLNERLFPVHHPENPLLGHTAREALREEGIELRTSRDREQEERYLFDLATTRATELLILSYAAFDESGEAKLPSFYLERIRQQQPLPSSPCVPVRPRRKHARPLAPRPSIRESSLLHRIAAKHASLSPSSLERFLQCPFAFFSEKTLRLRAMPTPPSQRLDALLEGDIVHAVLAELLDLKTAFKDWEAVFERVFEERCTEAGVPQGYRKQTAKLELRNSLARLVASGTWPDSLPAETEREFEFPLAEDLSVRGRMDRVHLETSGGPLVIDYKYSPPYKLTEYVRGNEEGRLVQAGLYLAAVQTLSEELPGGMLFCALRNGPEWKGWHTLAEWAPVAPLATEEEIARLMETARNASKEASRRIRAGETTAAPADEVKCSYCLNRDICRVEAVPFVRVAGGDSP